MAFIYTGKNIRPFTAVCGNKFGRKVIYTNQEVINAENVVNELNKALSTHNQNAIEIEYLDNYYRGDQPILYRQKKNRPEINNKVVVNLAQFIVDTNASSVVSEPIQFVLKGDNEAKSKEIQQMCNYFDEEDKQCDDIELCRWRSICGTAYRFVGKGKKNKLFSESPFGLTTLDPDVAFVCYYSNKTPAFGCHISEDTDGKTYYLVFTNSEYFKIKDGEIVEKGLNGNGEIPIVEYPNNARRLSDIEITILLTDEINKLTADRSNGIEQFVQAWVKFVNCDIDIDKFRKVRDEGFFSVTTNEGASNKADVDIMSQELDQSQSQVAVDDLFEKLLIIQGIANREGNTGGDTGSAVQLRNGHSAQEQKAMFNEPIFKRSEKAMLRLVLNRMKIDLHTSLTPADIEIKITRSKNTNMLTKAEVLKILLDCGIDKAVAIKTVDLFSDPERVTNDSRETIDKVFEYNYTKDTKEKEPQELNNGDQKETDTPEPSVTKS